MLKKIGWIVLINIYLVILAGSVVRMTGSGMGCPDWPMCFGYVIPPTNESQITWKPNKEYFEGQMVIKEFSSIQETQEIESAIQYRLLLVAQSDFKSADNFDMGNWVKYEKHDYAIFKVYHTWIEYINRLIGALLGFFAFLMLLFSLKKWKKDKWLVICSILQVVFIGFQAWLGKVTVDNNLEGKTVTYHMLGSLVLILIQILFLKRLNTKKQKIRTSKLLFYSITIAILLLLTQIILGTQVRQEVDLLLSEGLERLFIVNEFSVIPYIHRSFSILLVICIAFLSWKMFKIIELRRQIIIINITLWAIVFIGIYLFYFGLKPIGQPLHLLFSLLLFGFLVNLFLSVKKSKP